MDRSATFARWFFAGVAGTVLAIVAVEIGGAVVGALLAGARIPDWYTALGEPNCLSVGGLSWSVASALLVLTTLSATVWRGSRPIWIAIALSESVRLLPATAYLWILAGRNWSLVYLPNSALLRATPATVLACLVGVFLVRPLWKGHAVAIVALLLGVATPICLLPGGLFSAHHALLLSTP